MATKDISATGHCSGDLSINVGDGLAIRPKTTSSFTVRGSSSGSTPTSSFSGVPRKGFNANGTSTYIYYGYGNAPTGYNVAGNALSILTEKATTMAGTWHFYAGTYVTSYRNYGDFYIYINGYWYSNLQYNTKGGSGEFLTDLATSTTTSTSAPTDRSVVLPTETPYLDGYDFVGWSTTSANPGTRPSATIYSAGSTFPVPYKGSNSTSYYTTLYAVYDLKTWYSTLRYDTQGGTPTLADDSATSQSTTQPEARETTVSSTEPFIEGKIFQGWSTTQGGAVEYVAGDTISVAYAGSISQTTLYAVYKSATNCMFKSGGTWVKGQVYVKENGTWKKGQTWVKQNGTWKK